MTTAAVTAVMTARTIVGIGAAATVVDWTTVICATHRLCPVGANTKTAREDTTTARKSAPVVGAWTRNSATLLLALWMVTITGAQRRRVALAWKRVTALHSLLLLLLAATIRTIRLCPVRRLLRIARAAAGPIPCTSIPLQATRKRMQIHVHLTTTGRPVLPSASLFRPTARPLRPTASPSPFRTRRRQPRRLETTTRKKASAFSRAARRIGSASAVAAGMTTKTPMAQSAAEPNASSPF